MLVESDDAEVEVGLGVGLAGGMLVSGLVFQAPSSC